MEVNELKMREALEFARVAIEPFDDEKPRCWKTDHERLRQAHSVVKAALAQPAAVVELTDDELMDIARPNCGNFRWPSTALDIMRQAIAAHEAKRAGGTA